MKAWVTAFLVIFMASTAMAETFKGTAKVDIYDGFGNSFGTENVKFIGEKVCSGKILAALNFESYGNAMLAANNGKGRLEYQNVTYKIKYSVIPAGDNNDGPIVVMGVFLNTDLVTSSIARNLVAILIWKDFKNLKKRDLDLERLPAVSKAISQLQ